MLSECEGRPEFKSSDVLIAAALGGEDRRFLEALVAGQLGPLQIQCETLSQGNRVESDANTFNILWLLHAYTWMDTGTHTQSISDWVESTKSISGVDRLMFQLSRA